MRRLALFRFTSWLALTALAAMGASVAGCAESGPPFSVCAGADECMPPADGCYELLFTRSDGSEARGRQCSLACAADVDCPPEAVCATLDGAPTETRLCLATCEESADCFAGLRCTQVSGGGDAMSLCLP